MRPRRARPPLKGWCLRVPAPGRCGSGGQGGRQRRAGCRARLRAPSPSAPGSGGARGGSGHRRRRPMEKPGRCSPPGGGPRGPVLHIAVVGFHHKKGCQVRAGLGQSPAPPRAQPGLGFVGGGGTWGGMRIWGGVSGVCAHGRYMGCVRWAECIVGVYGVRARCGVCVEGM